MIARAPYLFLLLIIIPDLYFDLHYWRHKYSAGQRFCRWLPTIGLVAYTIYLMYEKNFIPDNPTIIYIYLFLLGLIAIPKVVYMLFSLAGLSFSHLLHRKKSAHPHKNYGNLIGLICVPILWFILIYGSFVGFSELEVNRHVYTSPDIPKAFNGYRIVQFSDAHVGSYTGSDWKLTVKDDTRPVFEASVIGSKTVLKDGAVKLKYEGASAGANEYISAVIEDAEGNILYYGNIARNTSADAADSGKAAINVPEGLTPGNYVIKVFSEQCNGSYKTDLASNIVSLDITISKYKTADRNLCIGIGAAIAAAACVAAVLAVRKKKHA